MPTWKLQLDNLAAPSGLGASYTAGGTTITPWVGFGSALATAISQAGASALSPSNTLDITVYLVANPATHTVFTATAISGDVLTGTATGGLLTTQVYPDGSLSAVVQGLTSAEWVKLTGAVDANTTAIALKAPLASPALTGTPTAPTAANGTNTTQIATTAFVLANVGSGGAVTSVAGRTGAVVIGEGDVTNLTADLAAKAPLASPALTGSPTAPSPATADSSTALATTAFVKAQGYLSTAPVTSVAGRTGAVVLAESDVTSLVSDLALKAPSASPTFTGAISNNGKTVYSNSYTGTLNDDNASDHTTATATVDNGAYCSFDAQPLAAGSSAYNHVAGYQFRPNYSGSGSVAELRGFWAQPNVTGTGTVTNSKQFMVNDPNGSGPITHNYGIYIGTLTRGSTDNYPIYSMATGPAVFSGQIQVGITANTTGAAATDGQLSARGFGAAASGMLNVGWNTTSQFGWLQSAVYGTAYAPTKINPNGGNVLVGASTSSIGFYGGTGAVKQTGDVAAAMTAVGMITSPTYAAASLTGTVAVANGGTGQATANAGLNALLPSQTTASGKVLTSNGTDTSWTSVGGTGTVTTVSVVTANGFAGSVANATTTPAITVTTTITGLLKGNGTAISAATAGTDYLAPTGSGASLTGITESQVANLSSDLTTINSSLVLKAPLASPTFSGTVTVGSLAGLVKATAGALSAATAGTDYLAPSGSGAALTGITESQVTNLVSDLAAKAPLASPTFTGSATMPVRIATITADTDGATITFDLSASDWHSVTLGGNRTLALSNPAVGQQFSLMLKQDGTGSRTVTWFSGILWPAGTAPTLTTTAAKTDVFTFKCTAAGVYLGFVAGQSL